jgi:hypothetical protein
VLVVALAAALAAGAEAWSVGLAASAVALLLATWGHERGWFTTLASTSAVLAAVTAIFVNHPFADYYGRQFSVPVAGTFRLTPPIEREEPRRTLLRGVLAAEGQPVRMLGPLESRYGAPLLWEMPSLAGWELPLPLARWQRVHTYFGLRAVFFAGAQPNWEHWRRSRPFLDLMALAIVGAATPATAHALERLGFEEVAALTPQVYYRNPQRLPRATIVHAARVVADEDAAFTAVVSPDFDPRAEVVLEEPPAVALPANSPPVGASAAAVDVDGPERVVVDVRAAAPGLVVLADAFASGWEARVDGAVARIQRADYLFRAVPVSAGAHEVEFRYRPAAFRFGALISMLGLVLLALATLWQRRGG